LSVSSISFTSFTVYRTSWTKNRIAFSDSVSPSRESRRIEEGLPIVADETVFLSLTFLDLSKSTFREDMHTAGETYTTSIELRRLEAEPLTSEGPGEAFANDPPKAGVRRSDIVKARFSGWRGGVLASMIVTTIVLSLNVILAIVAATTWNAKDGIATAFTGDCTTAERWTTGLHLLINLLGSVLLGATNYCMQRLVAPTRRELNAAHASRKWLDIGAPSVRNLFMIGKGRVALWALLGLTSWPLHLLWVVCVPI
jgi:hypothetical protein